MEKSKLLKFPFKRYLLDPPKELKEPGRKLWRAIESEYAIQDPGGLAHLTSACRAEDDIRRLRRRVAKDGDIIFDRFRQKKEHPLLSEIRGLEAVKRQALSSLRLDIEPLRDKPGRPPGK